MPRPPRLHVPGGFYHVILRGNHQEPIFRSPADRGRLNELVGEAVAKHRLRVHAYCWMTNHLHAVIQVGDEPLARPMQNIAMRYARYFQRREARVGHLFERRYRALLVDADRYLLALVRYVHQNPVRAGMVGDVEDYPWSSHRDYLGRSTVPWLTVDFVLDLFGAPGPEATHRYQQFMAAAPEPGLPDFDGPQGGQPQRLEPEAAQVLLAIAARHCERAGVTLGALRSRSRARRLARVRAAIAVEAQATGIGSFRDIAALLGRTHSTLAQSVAAQRPEPE